MRKNNKGFTLIEIIAVVAILGIISVVVVPNIFSLVTQSRDEIYLQDARRLIAQAQYKMSSNSSNIEKPSNGECIVMSLNYLNINDFQSPPHGGAYMSDASFVAIKSDGGTYKYAAMLVEHTSDGIYRGVKLSTEEDLNSKTAHKSITSFNSGEIRYIDSQTALAAGATEAAQVDTAYISRYLKDYGTNQKWLPADGEYIIGRYNYEKEVEHGAVDTSIPKISPKVISSDSKNPESLLVNLTVSATDADSPLSSLSVCSFVSREKDLNFPEAGSSFCDSYGTSGNYSKSFDLSKTENGGFSYNEQAIAYVYVAVYDPEKNSDRKKIEYFVRENEAPTIKSFNVIPADDGKFNLSNVKLSAEISDDMDNISDLKFCLQQDRDSEECNSYKSYSEFFNNGVHNYTFVDENGKNLGLDGSKHTLKLFVKDSLGKFSSLLVPYEIYKNEAPSFTKIEMIPNKLDNKNLYSVNFNIDAADDISNPYNLKIRICDDKMDVQKDCKFMSMSDYNNRERDGLFAFEFSKQEYDGNNRTVTVTLKDEHDLSTSETLTLTNVYKNKAPSIKIDSIVGSENVCANCNNGGSYNTRVSFTITDDLVDKRDFISKGFQICISEKKSDCEKQSNFQTYFGNETTYEFKRPSSDIYDGTDANKKLYIVVIDNFGAKGEAVGDYKIYKNQAPEIVNNSSFDFITTEVHNYCDGGYELDENGNYVCESDNIIPYSFNAPTVKFDVSNMKVVDDFNKIYGEVCYYFDSDSSNEKCYRTQNKDSLQTFFSDISSGFTFLDENGKKITNYDGQIINVRLKFTDNYGKSTATDYKKYTLYKDKPPEIKEMSFSSTNASDDPELVYNGNLVTFKFRVLDFNDKYTVCITENDECEDSEYFGIKDGDKESPFSGDFTGMNILSHSIFYDGEANGWDSNYLYKNAEDAIKKFNFFVKDSHGNIVKYNGNLNYNVYIACSNDQKIEKKDPLYDPSTGDVVRDENGNIVYTENNEIAPVDKNVVISADACGGKCYSKYNDMHGNLILNTYKARYARLITFVDRKSDTICESKYGDESDKYCNHQLCFMAENPYSVVYIGLRFDKESDDSSYETQPNSLKELSHWIYESKVLTEETPYIDQYCNELDRNNALLFNSRDSRCNSDVYCDNQGIINCTSEKEELDFATYSCSKYKLYNPKPCDSSNDANCYKKPLRPCLENETPSNGFNSVCLKTCDPGEDPEVNLCTPYSAHDYTDDYDIISPCEDENSSDCVHASKRTCDYGETPNDECIRMCGYKVVSGESVKENPLVDNCTNNPPLSAERKQQIYDACESKLREKYNTCSNNYVNECERVLNDTVSGFCNIDKSKEHSSWEEVACDAGGTDLSKRITRFCERNFIDGKCFNNSSKCDKICKSSDSDTECNRKLTVAGCQKICYQEVDCTEHKISKPKSFECTGFYKTYSSKIENDKLTLHYRGISICPEFYNYYDSDKKISGKDAEFPFKDENNNIINIEFNQEEQIVEE